MKRALITGITGQDGSFLAEFLLGQGYAVCGLVRRDSWFRPNNASHLADRVEILFVDMTEGIDIACAARKMAPVLQSMAVGQSGTLKAQYATIKDKQGRAVNPQVLEQLWSIVPPELVARGPQVAGVLYYAAKGYAAHHGLDEPTPPPRAPLLSEPSGGGRPAAPTLSSFDQAMRKAMQLSEKVYQETGSRFKPGSINVLED